MSSTHRTTHFSKFQYKLKSRSARASLAGLQRPLRAKSVPCRFTASPTSQAASLSVPRRPSASQHPRTSIERPSTSRHALRSEERYYAEEPSQVTLTRLGFPYCDKAAITHGMILSHPRNVLPRSLPVLPARVLDL